MSDGVLIAIALATSIVGMSALALSIPEHWQQVMKRNAQTAYSRRRLRLAGAILLAAAFLECAAADPLSMAALVWPMLLTIAAAIVAATLTLRNWLSARSS